MDNIRHKPIWPEKNKSGKDALIDAIRRDVISWSLKSHQKPCHLAFEKENYIQKFSEEVYLHVEEHFKNNEKEKVNKILLFETIFKMLERESKIDILI